MTNVGPGCVVLDVLTGGVAGTEAILAGGSQSIHIDVSDIQPGTHGSIQEVSCLMLGIYLL